MPMPFTIAESETQGLIQRLKGRDAAALGELYDLYGRLAYHVILRMVMNHATAEDLTQEAFLRIWNGVRGFDESRGALRTWVVAVARNCTIDYLRSTQARLTREAIDLDRAKAVTSSVGSAGSSLEVSTLLDEALERLTENERLVLDLCYAEGMTHVEIATCLDRPLGTVKTWIRKALQTMRMHLEVAVE